MADTTTPTLTEAELRVVRLLPYGLTGEQIAARIGLAPNTVKSHLRRINERWGTSGRTQLLMLAYEHGLLPLAGDLGEYRETVLDVARLLGISQRPDGLRRDVITAELRKRLGLTDPGRAVSAVADEVLVIQPEESGGVLPKPWFITKDGMVGRQDFWQGTPTQLVGFVHHPDTTGDVDLTFDQFWADGTDAVDMFPVFAHADGTFNTYGHRRVASVRAEVADEAHNPCCSTHGVPMSCERYRRTHFVEVRPCCSADALRLAEAGDLRG